MTIERALRLLAGTMVLISLALTVWVHPAWALLTAFVGLNLLQSSFTNWCPAVWLFERIGLERGEPSRRPHSSKSSDSENPAPS